MDFQYEGKERISFDSHVKEKADSWFLKKIECDSLPIIF